MLNTLIAWALRNRVVVLAVAALALVPVLLGAVVAVHGAAGFFFNNPGGGWEFPAFWAVALLVQAGLGDGALALLPTRRAAPAVLPVAAE